MADVVELIERLKAERQNIEAELQQLHAEEKQADDQREGSPFGKREEGATEAFELEKRIALKKSLVANLAGIDNAIKKYESGTYGVCDICKNLIEPARLEALPQANLCLKCKAQQMKNAPAH